MLACGTHGGATVHRIDLRGGGLDVSILTFGATIQQLRVHGPRGPRHVVLGFDSCEEYLKQRMYMGCVVGRFANRIAAGRFALDGRGSSAQPQRERQSPARRRRGIFPQGVVDRLGCGARRQPVAGLAGGRGRLSGHAYGRMLLQHRRRAMPAHRAHRRHGRAHDREPCDPQLFQSRRPGRHPAPSAGDTGGRVSAGR